MTSACVGASDPQGRWSANRIASSITAATGGLGIVIAPRGSVKESIGEGTLVQPLGDFEAAPSSGTRWIYAVYPSARYLPLKVRKLIDFLVEGFRA